MGFFVAFWEYTWTLLGKCSLFLKNSTAVWSPIEISTGKVENIKGKTQQNVVKGADKGQ